MPNHYDHAFLERLTTHDLLELGEIITDPAALALINREVMTRIPF